MNDVPIQIRNPEVVRAIRRLAAKRARAITEAIGEVVAAELESPGRSPRSGGSASPGRPARRIVRAEFNALPIVGRPLTDDDLYDEDGLPK